MRISFSLSTSLVLLTMSGVVTLPVLMDSQALASATSSSSAVDMNNLASVTARMLAIQTQLNTETDWHRAQALRAELGPITQRYHLLKARTSPASSSSPSLSLSSPGASGVDMNNLQSVTAHMIAIQTQLNTETDWHRAQALHAQLGPITQRYHLLRAQASSSSSSMPSLSLSSPMSSGAAHGALQSPQAVQSPAATAPAPAKVRQALKCPFTLSAAAMTEALLINAEERLLTDKASGREIGPTDLEKAEPGQINWQVTDYIARVENPGAPLKNRVLTTSPMFRNVPGQLNAFIAGETQKGESQASPGPHPKGLNNWVRELATGATPDVELRLVDRKGVPERDNDSTDLDAEKRTRAFAFLPAGTRGEVCAYHATFVYPAAGELGSHAYSWTIYLQAPIDGSPAPSAGPVAGTVAAAPTTSQPPSHLPAPMPHEIGQGTQMHPPAPLSASAVPSHLPAPMLQAGPPPAPLTEEQRLRAQLEDLQRQLGNLGPRPLNPDNGEIWDQRRAYINLQMENADSRLLQLHH